MYASSLTFPGDLFADFDELQRQMERVFGPRRATSSIRAAGGGSFPAINVGSTPDATEIYAFAPGIDTSTLDVSVDRGLLTIAAERKDALENADGGKAGRLNVYARERPTGRFRRVISLPQDADPDKVDASYRNGVLHIRVQKRETSRPRRIEISDAR